MQIMELLPGAESLGSGGREVPPPLALPLSEAPAEESTEMKQLGNEPPHRGSGGEDKKKAPNLSNPWGNATCEGKRPGERPRCPAPAAAPAPLPWAIVCQPHNGRFYSRAL